MLNRLSANALLKSVIAVMAAAVIIVLASGAWTSWQRLVSADRVASTVRASAFVFEALHNVRLDRSFSTRWLNAPAPITSAARAQVQKPRAAEMPALRAAAELLPNVEFAEKSVLVPALQRSIKALEALHTESDGAFDKPKAERRANLANEMLAETTTAVDLLDKLSAQLGAAIKQVDPVIDQMMMFKELAWVARNSGGDASVTVSNGLASGKLAPDAFKKYTTYGAQGETAWDAIQNLAYGVKLPANLVNAIETTGKLMFDPAFIAKRDGLLAAQLAGEKPEMDAVQWSALSVTRLDSVIGLADAALDAAKAHAASQHEAALWDLVVQLVLLGLAVAVATTSMIAVSRRVIRPLHQIQDAMLKVASGDLSAEAAFPGRTDEIGALAGALGTFKQNAAEKARIEEEQKDRNTQRAKRQEAIEGYIKSFEGQVREALEALGTASGQMLMTSDGISKTAERSTTQVQAVASASEEASANVQTVAAASEQLSSSIAEISQQVARAANIAGRAVDETKQTDGTVQGLVEAAARIGEVVKLINDIAGQTNLLALNATIEAARAGEAGKGFAVVASEVKSLANQTAKATEDISAQITAVQNVTKDAVEAIKRIGGTIGEVSSVATSIASAVEEQGAATKEITRNTHEAAQRTKDVSRHIGDVREGANATGTAAHGVKSAAEALRERAEQLRAGVNDFLGKIRAA
jgi:methyl-accepting chemotaxis protein